MIKQITQKLLDIETNARLTSDAIDLLCDKPKLLKQYLESSITNTFSELIFRLTHERYVEEKAHDLWQRILAHKVNLKEQLNRDVGILVASLDYLSNISGDLTNPKIIDDSGIEKAATMATRDSLTGLYLRGVFDFSLQCMIQEHVKYNKVLSLLLLDIDNFKKVNDVYGHQTGDEVLRKIGKVILTNTRQTDFAARFGGEEIAIILPKTSAKQARVIADRLCKNVALFFVKNVPKITASIGVSFIHKPKTTGNELIWQADRALYKAKCNGKNKVEIYNKGRN